MADRTLKRVLAQMELPLDDLRADSVVKRQNTDFLREEAVRQVEELIASACEKAKLCDLSADELKEMIDIVYGGY